MIVMPFSHTLKKQELIDIYQGIMPDSSLELKKVFSSFEINPTRVPPMDAAPGATDLFDHHFTPEFKDTTNSSKTTIGPQHAAALTGFLSPLSFVEPPLNEIKDDGVSGKRPYKTSADFYRNLRFMVFKAKQRAKKDYSNYRKTQIVKAVKTKINSAITPGTQLYHDISDSEYKDITKNKTIGDVFGANWPYDYFSLIQSLKIDITFSDI